MYIYRYGEEMTLAETRKFLGDPSADPDIERRSPDGQTLLTEASRRGYLQVVSLRAVLSNIKLGCLNNVL